MQRLGLKAPIIQAPMTGGMTTPVLFAAVCNAGALGSLGAGYMDPEQIRTAMRSIKSLTDSPFNVNLFVPEDAAAEIDVSSAVDALSLFWRELTDEPFDFQQFTRPSFDEQVQAILEEKTAVFSFTFGIPSLNLIQQFKRQGTLVVGTATTPEEAIQLEQANVDAIVCQGYESGGHRGTFSKSDPLYGLSALLPLIAANVKVPLVAAGGIMNGSGVAAALAMGACAAQLGTAFLTTTESGAHVVYKEALLNDTSPTQLTKVFSGKDSRAIANEFMAKYDLNAILPYPAQHFLTLKLRALAAKKGRPEFMSLWAGQGYPLCRAVSAASLVHQISDELSQIMP